ncbi:MULTISPECIES: hypothetical protein [Paenochrobactrum]|uniref:hypothetical protein n=1 Tax=Paenochrobactrum pullorum TaxID=1324351 RepID=UPI0035BBB4D9
MFEKADQIRRSFFLNSSETPNVSVNIKALSVPENIKAAVMQIVGTCVTGTPQQKDVVSIYWPGEGSNRTSKFLIFTDSWNEVASASAHGHYFVY